MKCLTMQLRLFLSTEKTVLSSETGSAVLGFAVGAPFVLFVFMGFIELSNSSLSSTFAQVQEKLSLQENSLEVEDLGQRFIRNQLDEVQMFTYKGSDWNLWRVKE